MMLTRHGNKNIRGFTENIRGFSPLRPPLAPPLQTTVRKGRGNSTVSKSIFSGVFFSTYTIIFGIHRYIFHNRECDLKKKKIGGGTTLGLGGDNPPSPPGFTPLYRGEVKSAGTWF